MSIKFLALIVIYGIDPINSSSLRTLLANKFDSNRLRIVVWDNSPLPLAEKGKIKGNGLIYRSTPENIGLSTIYNKVIAEILHDDEHLLLLDQDSVLPPNFLLTAEQSIVKHPEIDLFLPMIYANGFWASPLKYFYGWGQAWKKPKLGIMKTKQVCAINSGMVISAKYLLTDFSGYDERLHFYGTDTQFMLDYADSRTSLVIIDAILEHDLSFFSSSIKDRLKKFKSMKSAYKYIYEKRGAYHKFFVNLVMFIVSLIYVFRYREIRFLF